MKKRVCLVVLSILTMIATTEASTTWRDVAEEWLKTDSYADVNYDGIVDLIDYDLVNTYIYEVEKWAHTVVVQELN